MLPPITKYGRKILKIEHTEIKEGKNVINMFVWIKKNLKERQMDR